MNALTNPKWINRFEVYLMSPNCGTLNPGSSSTIRMRWLFIFLDASHQVSYLPLESRLVIGPVLSVVEGPVRPL